jgi:hypothetical protein
MAHTTATWASRNSPPSLASLNVGDDVTITGQFATMAMGRDLINPLFQAAGNGGADGAIPSSGAGRTFLCVSVDPANVSPQCINIKRLT